MNPFQFYFRHQTTPFVILFIERDGSTYLSSLLKSHPQIEMVYERFSVLKQKGVGADIQNSWLRDYYSAPFIGRKKAIGFKTKLIDVLDMQTFEETLRAKNCKIIQIRRKNLIKAVISKINARRLFDATGKWNLYQEKDRMPPLELAIDELNHYIDERETLETDLIKFTKKINLSTLRITYEDLLLGKDEVVSDILTFLKVPAIELVGKTKKHTSDDLRNVILNFDSLVKHYEGTKYENMFTEILV